MSLLTLDFSEKFEVVVNNTKMMNDDVISSSTGRNALNSNDSGNFINSAKQMVS